MKKDLTELVFILDRSGSMCGLEEDTIGGFNSMIERQRAEGHDVLVSTVLFDDEIDVVHDRVQIADVEQLTRETYFARGMTALLDAVGGAIGHIGNVHKYARSEDVPEHTMVVIATDGMENASTRYTASRVKSMVKRQKNRFGWEFIFLGANIDAVESANHIGIAPRFAMNYVNDGEGVRKNFEAVAQAACCMAEQGELLSECFEEVRLDFRRRGGRR